MDIRATVLIDNISQPPLLSEWGLSILIDYRGSRLLLDTGKSSQFAENACLLGEGLPEVRYGVLSHAHYDHADGMDEFFRINPTAGFWLREGTEENCFSGEGEERHYIGIKRGTLEKHRSRIRFAAGDVQLFEGAWLLPHKTDMEQAGRRAHMYLQTADGWDIDRFSHEQSLVLETAQGLVIFNSCCHGGADVIIEEVRQHFGREVHALVGGLHLFRSSDEEVLSMAERLAASGVRRIITGHCTGDRGYELLQTVLGDRLEQMYSGMRFEI